MAFTDTWDDTFEASPTDDNYGYEIDNYIRRTIEAVRERMETDHVWKSGTDDGEHKVITLQVQAAPSAVANKGKLYTKDVNSKVELCFTDEDGDEIQLTNAGTNSGVPEGTIIPWVGGYFGDGSNGSYADVLGNTVTDVNTLLNSKGWYVCDGSELNDSDSTIFNGSSRYLPNLTDDRFLMGDTTAGGIDGLNTSIHSHEVNTNVGVANHDNHTALTISSHTHTVAAHNHKWYKYVTIQSQSFDSNGTAGNLSYLELDQIGISVVTTNEVDVTGTAGIWVSYQMNTDNYTDNQAQATSSGTTATMNQNITAHSAHSITNNQVTSGTPSDGENRPLYLAVFYIMKVR